MRARKRDVKAGAYLIATIALAFVAVSLIADIAGDLGMNVGELTAGVFGKAPIKHADVEKCDCEYNPEFRDYMCNEHCGDMSGAFCANKADCLI